MKRIFTYSKSTDFLSKVSFILLYYSIFNVSIANATIADYETVPNGTNPTLYDVGRDRVIQLDVNTFNDTVFCSKRSASCTSFIVEFYSDWCGHCRAYAPLYKALALDIYAWRNTIKVAVINCADPFNELICRANGVTFFPFLKYFPRNSTDANFSVKLKPYQSLSALRDQITQVLVQDYAINHFADWPNFDNLGEISSVNELWEGSRPSAALAAVVFDSEPNSLIGAQLLLDLHQQADRIVMRRAARTHSLANLLLIVDFPTVVVFRRGEQTPILITELRRFFTSALEDLLRHDANSVALRGSHPNDTTAAQVIEAQCAKNPDDCIRRYYVSESDMLKAIHYALAHEVPRDDTHLSGVRLSALRDFLDLLATHFPHATIHAKENTSSDDVEESQLDASGRARKIFAQMRNFVNAHIVAVASDGENAAVSTDGAALSANEWVLELNRSTAEHNHPFPESADWEHCRGSSPHFRGYTCGLWTAFHALTVTAFKNSRAKETEFRPIPVLYAIRDWVGSFFGCEHCRNHFLKMTTKTAKIEARVRKADDVFLYLWKAHNLVNARLKNRETEDPIFPKFQFPAPFLCPRCRRPLVQSTLAHNETSLTSDEFDEAEVRNYLLQYYSNIKPVAVTVSA